MNSSFFFFLLVSSLLLLLFHGGHVHGDVDLIGETCKKAVGPTLKYDFCVASLQADPKSQNADLQGLGIISMELAIKNATFIASHIKGLLDTQDQPELKQPLEDCQELYSDQAVSKANEAIQAFQSKDYSLANLQMSAVSDASTTCEDGFKEKGLTSPVSIEDNVFFRIDWDITCYYKYVQVIARGYDHKVIARGYV